MHGKGEGGNEMNEVKKERSEKERMKQLSQVLQIPLRSLTGDGSGGLVGKTITFPWGREERRVRLGGFKRLYEVGGSVRKAEQQEKG